MRYIGRMMSPVTTQIRQQMIYLRRAILRHEFASASQQKFYGCVFPRHSKNVESLFNRSSVRKIVKKGKIKLYAKLPFTGKVK